jgi:hypothetical protein
MASKIQISKNYTRHVKISTKKLTKKNLNKFTCKIIISIKFIIKLW